MIKKLLSVIGRRFKQTQLRVCYNPIVVNEEEVSESSKIDSSIFDTKQYYFTRIPKTGVLVAHFRTGSHPCIALFLDSDAFYSKSGTVAYVPIMFSIEKVEDFLRRHFDQSCEWKVFCDPKTNLYGALFINRRIS